LQLQRAFLSARDDDGHCHFGGSTNVGIESRRANAAGITPTRQRLRYGQACGN
jgi:hypothetical protein